MNTNSSENLFQSFDTIVDWKLQQITVFDKTEICTIVSQDENNKNKYWVSNEAGLRYEAYNISDSKSEYSQNQKVYVTIPQGNYEFKKIILGVYEADEKPKPLYMIKILIV